MEQKGGIEIKKSNPTPKRGFFIDIERTLVDLKYYLPYPGAIEFVNYLYDQKIPFVLLTNNTRIPTDLLVEYLRDEGFKFDHYLDPLMVLTEELSSKNLRVYGHQTLKGYLTNKGYKIDSKKPDQLVLGSKLYSNEELSEIIEYMLKGVRVIATNQSPLYLKKGKRYPGLGAILRMLKYATQRGYRVVGKPSIHFFERARKLIGLPFDRITFISDDLRGDLLPAKKLGMETVLVLTGKIKSPKEVVEKPDLIVPTIGDYFEKFKRAQEKDRPDRRGDFGVTEPKTPNSPGNRRD